MNNGMVGPVDELADKFIVCVNIPYAQKVYNSNNYMPFLLLAVANFECS